MNFQDAQIGQQVVRTKDGYVVGRVGEVFEKDEIKNRVRVAWTGKSRTWVSCNAVEPTFIPYDILIITDKNGLRRRVYRRK